MKKDILNGKIADAFTGMVKFTLIMCPAVFLMCCAIFVLIAATYDKVEDAARVFMYIVGALSGLAAIVYPLITLHLIRIYPKHRKITKLFIQEYVFK